MKNTKHTENLDNSTPQEITSQSKRKILTSIGVSSGILGASALSQQWTKPIVNSIILPAHAQTTDMMGTDPMDGTDPMTDPTTPPATTPEPAMGPMIMVRRFPANGMVGDGEMATLYVSLNQMPMVNPEDGSAGMVMVNISADPMDSISTDGITNAAGDPIEMLTFNSMADSPMHYMKEQVVKVTAAGDVPDDADVMVKFMAEGGGYDDVEASAMFTIVEDDNVGVTEVKAMQGEGFANRKSATVTWMAPATSAMPDGYVVTSNVADVDQVDVTSGTSASFMDLPGGDHTFTVTAVYGKGTPASVAVEAEEALTIPAI